MIIEHNEEKEAIAIGNIQNNKVGIDRNNIDFITTLLSTNLYSEPIQSFLRETVANGWDSQVEAGNTDTPLIIRVTRTSYDDVQISIRDFGTGLSPERFDTIYRNIGSSTKRDTNDYIGCMGIGRFAALACSNIVHINSFYNNICYSYVMYKDGSSICIDKLNESSGNYQNGVEVIATVCKSTDCTKLKNIIKGIEALSYFEGGYLEVQDNIFSQLYLNQDFIKSFNDRKIHDFGPFKICTNCIESTLSNFNVLMGNVLYPIKSELVSKYMYDLKVPIALKCDIGELDITPNREELQYNTKTIKNIEAKLVQARELLSDIIKKYLSVDFSSLYEWFNIENSTYTTVPLYKFDENIIINILIFKSTLSSLNIQIASTINGITIPKNMFEVYKKFLNVGIPSELCTYKLYSNKFYVERASIGSIHWYIERYINDRIFLINEPFKPITKKYFIDYKNKLGTYYFVNSKDFKKYFFRIVKSLVLYYNSVRKSKDIVEFPKKALKLIWSDFKQYYLNPPTFNNSDVPQDYKDANKVVKIKKAIARKCVIYTLVDSDRYDYNIKLVKPTLNNTIFTLENLPKFKGRIIYAEKDNPDLVLLYSLFRKGNYIPNISKYKFVEVAPSNLPILASFKNCTSLDLFLLYKDPIISKIITSLYLKKDLGLAFYHSLIDSGIEKIDNLTKNLKNYLLLTDSIELLPSNSPVYKLVNELYDLYIKKNWLDINFLECINEIPNYVNYYKFICSIANDTSIAKQIASNYFIHTNKICISNKYNLNKIKSCLNIINNYESIQIT